MNKGMGLSPTVDIAFEAAYWPQDIYFIYHGTTQRSLVEFIPLLAVALKSLQAFGQFETIERRLAWSCTSGA